MSPFEVVVLHTETSVTQKALKAAGQLADGLAARIRLLVPYVVPYPLPLDEPPVAVDFMARRIQKMVEQDSIEIDIRLCRDRSQMLREALPPGSIVVWAEQSRWWPIAQHRLARQLRAAGHQIVTSLPRV